MGGKKKAKKLVAVKETEEEKEESDAEEEDDTVVMSEGQSSKVKYRMQQLNRLWETLPPMTKKDDGSMSAEFAQLINIGCCLTRGGNVFSGGDNFNTVKEKITRLTKYFSAHRERHRYEVVLLDLFNMKESADQSQEDFFNQRENAQKTISEEIDNPKNVKNAETTADAYQSYMEQTEEAPAAKHADPNNVFLHMVPKPGEDKAVETDSLELLSKQLMEHYNTEVAKDKAELYKQANEWKQKHDKLHAQSSNELEQQSTALKNNIKERDDRIEQLERDNVMLRQATAKAREYMQKQRAEMKAQPAVAKEADPKKEFLADIAANQEIEEAPQFEGAKEEIDDEAKEDEAKAKFLAELAAKQKMEQVPQFVAQRPGDQKEVAKEAVPVDLSFLDFDKLKDTPDELESKLKDQQAGKHHVLVGRNTDPLPYQYKAINLNTHLSRLRIPTVRAGFVKPSKVRNDIGYHRYKHIPLPILHSI